jgi:hypothetical protein
MKTSLAQFASPPSQQVMAWALRYTISTLVLILNGPQEFSYMSFFSHVLYFPISKESIIQIVRGRDLGPRDWEWQGRSVVYVLMYITDAIPNK